jgi:hypothetical protein
MTTRTQPVNNHFSIHFERAPRVPEAAPHCQIFPFSGQAATVDLLEKARQPGHSFDVLAKPVKPEQLVSVIRSNVNQILRASLRCHEVLAGRPGLEPG